MVGYDKPCRHCGELVPPDANHCPHCAKVNPFEIRCQGCRMPIKGGWKVCPGCGLQLNIPCPSCGKTTFFDDYCIECGQRLLVTCSHCHTDQPPIDSKCVKCKRKLEVRR